jgi:uncharacterized protein YndB with AHSA1/START domain
VIEHDFQTTVARSPLDVFDFLVDLRNAPQWEPNCREVKKTSDGPIGKGTTFRAKKGMGRLESEIVEFERPARFASRDRGRGMSCGLDFAAPPRTRHAGVRQAVNAATGTDAWARAADAPEDEAHARRASRQAAALHRSAGLSAATILPAGSRARG